MDTSKQYIKMCEKAGEIQGLCKYESGDFLVSVFNPVEVLGDFIKISSSQATSGGYDYDFYDVNWEAFLWLPRQDQLQEIVQGEKHSHLLVHEFALWCHGGEEFGRRIIAFPCCDWSMEQLWLGFVMHRLHNKVWNGEDWVAQEEK